MSINGLADRIALRQLIAEVPAPDTSLLRMTHRDGQHKGLGTNVEVKPYKNRWEWSVALTFNGHDSMMDWMEGGSWRRPRPDCVHGRSATRADAEMAARYVVQKVQQRYAELHHLAGRTYKTEVPL